MNQWVLSLGHGTAHLTPDSRSPEEDRPLLEDLLLKNDVDPRVVDFYKRAWGGERSDFFHSFPDSNEPNELGRLEFLGPDPFYPAPHKILIRPEYKEAMETMKANCVRELSGRNADYRPFRHR